MKNCVYTDKLTIDQLKRKALIQALADSHGCRGVAAYQLGISTRALRNWIRRYELQDMFPNHTGVKSTKRGEHDAQVREK